MTSPTRRLFGGILTVLWLGGCVATPQSDALLDRFFVSSSQNAASQMPASLQLESVPFFPQEDYQCGPAALASLLQASAVRVSPEALVSQVYVPARRGSLQIEMLAAARRYGRVAYVLPASLDALLAELHAGRPVLVMQNLGLSRLPQWHYAVALGYDLEARELILHSGLIKNYKLALTTFERTWQRAEHWAVVLLRPGEMPVDNREQAYFQSVQAFAGSATKEAAALAYRVGLERWPASVTLGMAVANLAYEDGDMRAAQTAYLGVIEHSPDYAAAHNNLAHVLHKRGDLALARKHAERAVRLGGSFSSSFQETLDSIIAGMDR